MSYSVQQHWTTVLLFVVSQETVPDLHSGCLEEKVALASSWPKGKFPRSPQSGGRHSGSRRWERGQGRERTSSCRAPFGEALRERSCDGSWQYRFVLGGGLWHFFPMDPLHATRRGVRSRRLHSHRVLLPALSDHPVATDGLAAAHLDGPRARSTLDPAEVRRVRRLVGSADVLGKP